MQRPSYYPFFMSTFVLLGLFAGWDLLAQDLTVSRWFGDASGFAMRDHWLFSKILHQGARRVAWALQFLLVLAIWWPVGVLRLLTRRQRLNLLIAVLASLIAINLLKNASPTSCPWDLVEFGGNAAYVSHWAWGVGDGGVGRCFPAGHASAAFCFLSGYFWLRDKASRAALVWLALSVLAGVTIGLAQQVRGAHYMSHTLWTGWLCWLFAGLMHMALEREWRFRRPALARSAKS